MNAQYISIGPMWGMLFGGRLTGREDRWTKSRQSVEKKRGSVVGFKTCGRIFLGGDIRLKARAESRQGAA